MTFRSRYWYHPVRVERKYSYVGVLEVLGMFRGLQQRVAKKVGLDAAFVSRVARGERSSERVMTALMEEWDAIRDYLTGMPEHKD
jgi:hypothetical protein